MLVRAKEYDLFSRDLAGLATVVHREHDLKRNELVVLKVDAAGDGPIATAPVPPESGRLRE